MRSNVDNRIRLFGPQLDSEERASFNETHYLWVELEAEADFVIEKPKKKVADMSDPIAPLSSRELEILSFIADGWASAEIAQSLSLSVATVKFHLQSIYKKLGVNRRTEAVREAQKHRIIEW